MRALGSWRPASAAPHSEGSGGRLGCGLQAAQGPCTKLGRAGTSVPGLVAPSPAARPPSQTGPDLGPSLSLLFPEVLGLCHLLSNSKRLLRFSVLKASATPSPLSLSLSFLFAHSLFLPLPPFQSQHSKCLSCYRRLWLTLMEEPVWRQGWHCPFPQELVLPAKGRWAGAEYSPAPGGPRACKCQRW